MAIPFQYSDATPAAAPQVPRFQLPSPFVLPGEDRIRGWFGPGQPTQPASVFRVEPGYDPGSAFPDLSAYGPPRAPFHPRPPHPVHPGGGVGSPPPHNPRIPIPPNPGPASVPSTLTTPVRLPPGVVVELEAIINKWWHGPPIRLQVNQSQRAFSNP